MKRHVFSNILSYILSFNFLYSIIVIAGILLPEIFSANLMAEAAAVNQNGRLVPRYSLFNLMNKGQYFTTDKNEYDRIGASVNWQKEGIQHKIYDAPVEIKGIRTVPIYKLYSYLTMKYFWTGSDSEYHSLKNLPEWQDQGPDGHYFPAWESGVSGTIALYRLSFELSVNEGAFYYWTTNKNEYDLLAENHGWKKEGIAGFVFPKDYISPDSGIESMTAAGKFHTVGLKMDGTTIATGDNSHEQCDVYSWTGINQISTGAYHTVALTTEGTVMATGYNEKGQCDVSSWSDIIQVDAGGYYTVGLKTDGTVVAQGGNNYGQCNVESWSDIVQVAADFWVTVGLKIDGTVVSAGFNGYGQCNVSDWSTITQVDVGGNHTIGLKADGTVPAVGNNDYGQCDTTAWYGIKQVAAGRYHTLGLKADGSVVATGDNTYGQCNVASWSDIVHIATGKYHSIGLKQDGTVVAAGFNSHGQCDVSSWYLNVND